MSCPFNTCPHSVGCLPGECKHEADRMPVLAACCRQARRYEFVRTLNPRDYKALWDTNLRGEGPFDDLVDAAMEARRKELSTAPQPDGGKAP